MGSRTIIVGDVHGCALELTSLLERIGFGSGDRLVFVGDIVARGPYPLEVLDLARQTGAILVRGNHEQKLLDWYGAPGTGLGPLSVGRLHRELGRKSDIWQ